MSSKSEKSGSKLVLKTRKNKSKDNSEDVTQSLDELKKIKDQEEQKLREKEKENKELESEIQGDEARNKDVSAELKENLKILAALKTEIESIRDKYQSELLKAETLKERKTTVETNNKSLLEQLGIITSKIDLFKLIKQGLGIQNSEEEQGEKKE